MNPPEQGGLYDADALNEILDRAQDALRPVGMTFEKEQVNVMLTPAGMVAVLPVLIRESAKAKLTEDRESREEFNKMMARDHESKIEKEKEKIRKALLSGDLLGEEDNEGCSHENRHPVEGFCLDCGFGLED